MRVNWRLSSDARLAARRAAARRAADELRQWRPVFAWWPVHVGGGDVRWLERVWCRHPDAWYGAIFGGFYRGPAEYATGGSIR